MSYETLVAVIMTMAAGGVLLYTVLSGHEGALTMLERELERERTRRINAETEALRLRIQLEVLTDWLRDDDDAERVWVETDEAGHVWLVEDDERERIDYSRNGH